MTYIDDIVDGFYLAGALDEGLDGGKLAGRSFNIGSTEEISMRFLAESVNKTVGTMAVDMVLGGVILATRNAVFLIFQQPLSITRLVAEQSRSRTVCSVFGTLFRPGRSA